MVLTRDATPDFRLIEIAQVVKHPHQQLSGEGAADGAVGEPGAEAGITAHGHTGSLLFVQESELDTEIDAPHTGDIPPVDEAILYEPEPEPEPEPENNPVEVTEPVSVFASLP